MRRFITSIIAGAVLTASLAGCGSNASAGNSSTSDAEVTENVASEDAETTDVPEEASLETDTEENATTDISEDTESITIENYNRTTVYDKVPEKVIILSYNSAEVLSALGVADKIIAIQEGNNTVNDVLEEYRDALVDVPKPETINVQGGVPTLENIIAMEPDLIITNSYYFNVPTFGTPEDYEAQGINLYITEGSYVSGAIIENTYNDLRNLGQIFGVSDRAEEVIAEMQSSIDTVKTTVEGTNPIKVVMFDSEADGSPNVAGGNGLAQDILSAAGAENIFADVESQFTAGTWERVIEANPEVIVILKYGAEDDAEQKIELIKSKPELADVTAVKNNKFVVVPLFSVFPGVQNHLAVETIAKGLYPELFE